MEYAQHVAAIRRESDALASAARTAGIDAPVPSCPEWTIADLLGHIGRVQRYVAGIVTTRPVPPTRHWREDDPPPPDERLVWFIEGSRALADALDAAPPDDDVYTWAADRRVRFWARRQAHEAAVHRWDAQGAAGEASPIERELAADGVQEMFDVIATRPTIEPITGSGESIHLHCTDGEGEWLVRLTPDGLVVTNEHAKGDVAARGTASDLLLLVWGRIPPDQVEVFGDASLLSRWQALGRF